MNDQTHHLIFNCAAYDKEDNPGIKAFLSFVRGNSADSNFTKEIETMVQTKKFQNTFINEYLAINLHERDLRKRATEQGLQQGLQQGKVDAYIDLIKFAFGKGCLGQVGNARIRNSENA